MCLCDVYVCVVDVITAADADDADRAFHWLAATIPPGHINIAPSISTTPTSYVVSLNSPTIPTTTAIDPILVDDEDAADSELQVSFQCTKGGVYFTKTTGLRVATGTGTLPLTASAASATVSFLGNSTK